MTFIGAQYYYWRYIVVIPNLGYFMFSKCLKFCRLVSEYLLSHSTVQPVNEKVKSGVGILATGRALFEHLQRVEKNLMDKGCQRGHRLHISFQMAFG